MSRSVLRTLDEKIAPSHTALIVVDVQNAFCSPEGALAKLGRDISDLTAAADRLPPFIAAARAAGVVVVFVRNIHASGNNHYLSDVYRERAERGRGDARDSKGLCVAGEFGAEFYGDVQPGPDDPIVTKHRYSAFHDTDLETILRSRGVRTIVLTGVVANVCVETAAREGFNRDYYVVMASDGVGAFSTEDRQSALRNVDRFFGVSAPIADIATIWKNAQR